MCPACISTAAATTAALVAGSAIPAGGVIAFLFRKLRRRGGANLARKAVEVTRTRR
jgi:hypothetical protein